MRVTYCPSFRGNINVRYVGNSKYWVSFNNGKRKNPDFKIRKQKKVIEAFGDYWHRDDDPQELIDLYAEAGYECLVIWESEVNEDIEKVQSRIESFVEVA